MKPKEKLIKFVIDEGRITDKFKVREFHRLLNEFETEAKREECENIKNEV